MEEIKRFEHQAASPPRKQPPVSFHRVKVARTAMSAEEGTGPVILVIQHGNH